MRRAVVLALVVSTAAAVFASPATANRPAARPVPSLTPAATEKLWKQLVRQRRLQAATECSATRAIVYAQTDWMRLATKLAATPSPCAQYFISVPPLAADKTQPRGDQAWRIRALGPQFHALNEVHFTGWSSWVSTTGNSWYDAGVEARRRMADAGYDVSLGDGWAVNEFSSAVRRGDGVARQNVREFVRGLYAGDGSAAVRGVVFINGMAQSTSNLSLYKANLQNWLKDAAFWADMAAYVSDWAQENYGDFRHYGVAGASAQTRRDYLAQYLGHELALANVGPEDAAAARSFLQSAHASLSNAAWAWDSAYGWTNVAYDQMQGFVSTQVYAQRAFGDRVGFAWAPKNLSGMATADYTAQTGAILDRLAAAIRDAAEASADPGANACGPAGENLYCTGELEGSTFAPAWQTFSTWSPPSLGFPAPAAALVAGTPSGPLTVQLQTLGWAEAATEPTLVALSSGSAQGAFSTSADGPWAGTLTLTIPAGASEAAFYYRDTVAGTATLTATSSGRESATGSLTVEPGPVATLTLAPASASVPVGGSVDFVPAAADAYGNTVAVTPTWSVSAGTPGTVSAGGVFTASTTTTGSGSVLASAGGVSASAAVTVTAAPLKVSAITYTVQSKTLFVRGAVVDATTGSAFSGASVSISLYRNGSLVGSATATTGSDGRVAFTTHAKRGCYTTTVTKVAAQGALWDGASPANRYCV